MFVVEFVNSREEEARREIAEEGFDKPLKAEIVSRVLDDWSD